MERLIQTNLEATQFSSEYLNDYEPENMLKISSENDATTDACHITHFLLKTTNKIICVTYQSFKTLIENLGETKINVSIFDEAHHIPAQSWYKIYNHFKGKKLGLTATPHRPDRQDVIEYFGEPMVGCRCGQESIH